MKDFIESFGVPHTEVDLVLINGSSAAFSTPVGNRDRVSVYPPFRSLDVSSLTQVRPPVQPAPRFVLDVHLGRLAAYLRMLGFDSAYSNRASDPELARLAEEQDAILLTRDRYLLMRSEIARGHWVRSVNPKEQLLEVSLRFHLLSLMKPFTRCMVCNGSLQQVSRESVVETLPPKVAQKVDFRRCGACGQLYWEGTHHERMKRIVQWLRQSVQTTGGAKDKVGQASLG